MTTINEDWDDYEIVQEPDYITEATRREVLLRDQFRCRRCGETDLDKLHLHHVLFRSLLGKHGADNLVTLCSECHRLLHDGKVVVKRVLGKWFFGGSSHWRGRAGR